MSHERGREVYVVFEGVFALDDAVDPTSTRWVALRTADGDRVSLPIDAVVEWDVDEPLTR
jgi:hypothetical protein